jgi:hypothetical protein
MWERIGDHPLFSPDGLATRGGEPERNRQGVRTSRRMEDLRCQEVGVILASHLAGEVLCREVELVAGWGVGGQRVGALLEELKGVGLVDLLALSGGDAVLGPLPELAAGDLGGRSVLPVSGKLVSSTKSSCGVVVWSAIL